MKFNKIAIFSIVCFVFATDCAGNGDDQPEGGEPQQSFSKAAEGENALGPTRPTNAAPHQQQLLGRTRPTAGQTTSKLSAETSQQQGAVDLLQPDQGDHQQQTDKKDKAGSSDTVKSRRMMWPDRLLQQQVEGLLPQHEPLHGKDQMPFYPFLYSDQMDNANMTNRQPDAIDQSDHKTNFGNFGLVHDQSLIGGHHNLLSQPQAEKEQHSRAYPPMSPLNLNFDLKNAPIQADFTYSPTGAHREAFGIGQMNPPPQKRQSIEASSSRPNAAVAQTRPGFFTRLLMQTQKPLAELNIPRVPSPNPIQFLPGTPLGSPQSPNVYGGGMPLESPPPLHSLSLLSPTMQRPPAPPIGPMMPTSASPQKSSSSKATAAHTDQLDRQHQRRISSKPSNLLMIPNPPLTIREGAAEQQQQQKQQSAQVQPGANVDRKMKRPMHEDEAAEEPPTAIEQQQQMQMLRMGVARTAANDEGTATTSLYSKTAEDKVRMIIDLTLLSMDIPPSDMDMPLHNALLHEQAPNFDQLFALIDHRMGTTSAELTMESAEKLLMSSEMVAKVKELGWMMSDIRRQALRMFGRPLFPIIPHGAASDHQQQRHQAQAGTAPDGGEQPTIKVERGEQCAEKFAMMCFLYTRLYRKLAGMLQTPFFGVEEGAPFSNLNAQKIVTQSLLTWLSIARQKFAVQFDSIIKAKYSDFSQKQSLLARFEKSDETRERLNVAQLTIEVTLAPLLGPKVFSVSLAQSLAMMDGIVLHNLAKLIIERGTFDVMEIATFARNYNLRSGSASTFLQIFDATIHEYSRIGKWHNTITKILEIYWILYQKALNYLTPEFDQLLASENEHKGFVHCWISVKSFLTIASQQLDHFFKSSLKE